MSTNSNSAANGQFRLGAMLPLLAFAGVCMLQCERRTCAKIQQNLFSAFIHNMIGLPLAVLGMFSPAIVGATMAFNSRSVVINSLLLKRWKGAQQ